MYGPQNSTPSYPIFATARSVASRSFSSSALSVYISRPSGIFLRGAAMTARDPPTATGTAAKARNARRDQTCGVGDRPSIDEAPSRYSREVRLDMGAL